MSEPANELTAPAGSALADVALKVCREQSKSHVWYGDPQLCQEIYGRWGGTHTHPLNTIATVISACARSKRWKRDGYISHLGRRYPLYTPNTPHHPRQPEAGVAASENSKVSGPVCSTDSSKEAR